MPIVFGVLGALDFYYAIIIYCIWTSLDWEKHDSFLQKSMCRERSTFILYTSDSYTTHKHRMNYFIKLNIF